MAPVERKLYFLFLTLNVVPVMVSSAGYKITPFLTRAEVTHNLKYLNISYEIISTPSENRINFDINSFQTIYSPRAIVVLWLDIASGALKAPFYNQTIDICGLIRNPGTHRMVQIVYREVKRHGNVPTGCPFPSGLYKFRDLSPSQMRLPAFFAQTDFMMDIIGLAGAAKERTMETRWYGVINKVKCTANSRC